MALHIGGFIRENVYLDTISRKFIHVNSIEQINAQSAVNGFSAIAKTPIFINGV